MTAATSYAWDRYQWARKDEDGRTHEKVRRNSRPSLGRNEPRERITERQRHAWLMAYDRIAKQAKIKGKRRGHRGTFSWCARQILDYLLTWAQRTGLVVPSIKQIAEAVGATTGTVCKVLDALEHRGWITRERRFRPAPATPGEAGPRIEQDSNYYRVHLPIGAANLLAAWKAKRAPAEGGPEPVLPADLEKRRRVARLRTSRTDAARRLSKAHSLLAAARRQGDRDRLQRQIEELAALILRLNEAITALEPATPDDSASGPGGAATPCDSSDG